MNILFPIIQRKLNNDLKGVLQMIKLNKKIYKKEAIEQALTDFSECCEGDIYEEEKHYLIKLKPKEDVDLQIEKEFSNYVFGLMQNGIHY
jgi:hypothetical protein